MAAFARSVVSLAVALFVAAEVGAQAPIAPLPHPPLAELVKEYKRFGLPLLPANAQLVRIERYRYRWAINLEEGEARYDLTFRVPSAQPGGPPKYLTVDGFWAQFTKLDYVEPDAVEAIAPSPSAIDSSNWPGDRLLYLAVLCKARGWNELASAFYAQAREVFAQKEEPTSVRAEFHVLVGTFWWRSLEERGTDRRDALRQLKALAAEDETLRTPEHLQFFRQLELTLAPRTSKPGTVDALIDELTEYWDDPYSFLPVPAEPASYWRLAELGFDAVPALIAHLGDDRLTRTSSSGSQFGTGHRLTVGHLCSRLIFYLSAGTICVPKSWEAGGGRLDPAEARKWFETAQKVGEERWLVRHAIPPFVGRAIAYHEDRPVFLGKAIVSHEGRTEPHIVRVLGAKYPARLPAVYRTMLKIPVEGGILNDFVSELVLCKLPRDQKIALLEEGAASDLPAHWVPALEGLARLDQPLLRKHLRAALQRVWFRAWLRYPDPNDGSRLVRLVEAANDRECWDALASATKNVGVERRMDIIRSIRTDGPPDRADPMRLERVRFLVQFLDDRTLDSDEDETGAEVRDYTATQLAGLLGFRVHREPDLYRPVHNSERGPVSWLVFRAVVRQAATQALAEKK